MKGTKLFLAIALVALGFASCKDAKETEAQKVVDTYITYVDSLGTVASQDAKDNWQGIEATYQLRSGDAKAALANMKDKAEAQERLDAATAKYEALKAKYEAEIQAQNQAAAAANPKQQLRNALFGEGKIGDDMNFNWVNASNILSVYQQFVHTAENNKDSYSREDWDEVKLMYEALDSRKNTVENEGLTSDDNRKIAGLKLKFAPMLKLNRMGAKSDEMAKAKE
jgi:Skp family chaperone for outer membrane proteins